jgi:hypothetical protein
MQRLPPEPPDLADPPAQEPEVIDRRQQREEPPGWDPGRMFGGRGGGVFGPRSFAGGRVQVYGCSPGCILISLVVSVVLSVLLTLALNALIRAF